MRFPQADSLEAFLSKHLPLWPGKDLSRNLTGESPSLAATLFKYRRPIDARHLAHIVGRSQPTGDVATSA